MNKELYHTLIAAIDERFLLERLKEMIAIKSENPFDEEPRAGYREKEMGQYFAEIMSSLGLEVEYRYVQPDRPNVFGYRKGAAGSMTLMLAGHMDTARTDGYDAAYDVKEEKGKIFGRGSCDMKAALAAWFPTWSIAWSMKSMYMISTTGRSPAMAAPTPVPMIAASDIAVLKILSLPKMSSSP